MATYSMRLPPELEWLCPTSLSILLIKKCVPEGGYIGLTEEMVENHLSKLNRRTTIIKIKINEIIGKERP
jgi:hypothetical protein